jgi:hypothetical protein
MTRLHLLGVAAVTAVLCAIGTGIFAALTGLSIPEAIHHTWFEWLGVGALVVMLWGAEPQRDELADDVPSEALAADAIAAHVDDPQAAVIEPMSDAEAALHVQYQRDRLNTELNQSGVSPPPPARGLVNAGELRTRLEVIKADRQDLMARAAIAMCIDALDMLASEGDTA